MMKYAVIALSLSLAACSSQPDDMSDYLAKRDDQMAKLMDQNAALEKRVASLEAGAGLQSAEIAADRKAAQSEAAAADKKKIVDEIVNDKRMSDLENR